MAMASNSMYDGAFTVTATAKEIKNETKIPLDQLEKELWTYIEDAKTNPVDPQLLQRVKNSVEAQLPPEPRRHRHRRARWRGWRPPTAGSSSRSSSSSGWR